VGFFGLCPQILFIFSPVFLFAIHQTPNLRKNQAVVVVSTTARILSQWPGFFYSFFMV